MPFEALAVFFLSGFFAFMTWYFTAAYFEAKLDAVQKLVDSTIRENAALKITLASTPKEAKALCEVILAALNVSMEEKTDEVGFSRLSQITEDKVGTTGKEAEMNDS